MVNSEREMVYLIICYVVNILDSLLEDIVENLTVQSYVPISELAVEGI